MFFRRNGISVLFVLLPLAAITTVLSGCQIKEDRDSCPAEIGVNLTEVKGIMASLGVGSLVLYFENGSYYAEEVLGESSEQGEGGLGYEDGVGGSKEVEGGGGSDEAEDVGGSDEAEGAGGSEAIEGGGSGGGEIPDYCVRQVPRGTVTAGVRVFLPEDVTGERVVGTEGGNLIIERGRECPRVFMDAGTFYADVGRTEFAPSLHKNYCSLSIRAMTNGKPYPYALRIKGNVCGYGTDCSPIKGGFEFILIPDEQGDCQVNLPRQVDNTMVMEVLKDGGGSENSAGAESGGSSISSEDVDGSEGDKDSEDSGEYAEDGEERRYEVLRTFAIGEYIAAAGYDWRAVDLEDAALTLDFSTTGIILSTDKWSVFINCPVLI